MTNSFDDREPRTISEEPAPLVDEALEATGGLEDDARQELRALRAEVDRLQETLAAMASGGARLAMGEVRSTVRSRPFTAAITVAVLSFVYGATR